jgi:pimeloyl-ACP methyl ester carboxylesterase
VIVPYLRGYGTTRFLSDGTFRNGQQAAVARDGGLSDRQRSGRQAAVASGGRAPVVVPVLLRHRAGRAGYDRNRHDFAKLIWRTASPRWNFDDATFDRTAASFDNPDHVAIVIYNYRWRLGLADGEAEHDELEKRLAEGPVITVPAITLEGDANGAPHPDPSAYAGKFSGTYSHRTIEGGVGHNLPQEAPAAFADAVLAAGGGGE